VTVLKIEGRSGTLEGVSFTLPIRGRSLVFTFHLRDRLFSGVSWFLSATPIKIQVSECDSNWATIASFQAISNSLFTNLSTVQTVWVIDSKR
jgi:hypothetical protein